jgi:hypothetical protein
MMQTANWWLMALAFLLGLVLTLFLLIRRVKCEVPEYATLAGGAGVAAAGAAGAAGVAKLKGGAGVVDAEPYGAGSLRVKATATAPNGGYTVKGNEDSMLYHTTDSPSYKQTIAEVWFRDEPTAQAAGFTRWDKGRVGAATAVAGLADVPPGPHGPGSATPGAGGSGPEGWTVKGNEDSMLYHSPESPAYDVTVAEVWFRDVPTAEAAGFNRWDSGKSQRGKR